MTQPQIILSTHAQERMKLRQISHEMVSRVMSTPDRTWPGKKPQTTTFRKVIQDRRIEVVASYLAPEKKWLVVSVWAKGEQDPVPFTWILITAPFRLTWWVGKQLYLHLVGGAKGRRN